MGVSVWSKFDEKTSFYKEMKSKGFILSNSTNYDAWSADAQALFYSYSKAAHFSVGVDALWLDATEPELYPNVNLQTAMGSGNALMNTYSLFTTQAIADGLRRDFPEQQGARVFSLTRSAFAGQQRTGAALWSGDTQGTWDVLRRQITASINYQMSGMPYWSEDIGGFFRPSDQYNSTDYHQLLIRWFQFGTFTPIFRVHGAGSHTEIWNYGEETMSIINSSAISLRYRLLPYTYSCFLRAELSGYTVQRGLALDFPEDLAAREVPDQFMYGDAFMVAPFVASGTSRRVHFPQAPSWLHFHTGSIHFPGNREVSFDYSQAPLFVKSGSIVVLAPFAQHSGEVQDPLEVRIYGGDDAYFELFEDDGVSRDYQGGTSSIISFWWREAEAELQVGQRRGQFPGMLESRTLNIVWVRNGRGLGVHPSAPDVVVRYMGDATSVLRPDSVGDAVGDVVVV